MVIKFEWKKQINDIIIVYEYWKGTSLFYLPTKGLIL